MKIVWSKADVESLRDLLNTQLQPDEKVIWCGEPSADWSMECSKKYPVKLFAGTTMYIVLGCVLNSAISCYIAIAPGISACGCGALFALYMIAIWPAAVYAITTKRIIAVRWARFHSADISQIALCSEIRKKAWSDLIFSLTTDGRIRFSGLSRHDIIEIQPCLKEIPVRPCDPDV